MLLNCTLSLSIIIIFSLRTIFVLVEQVEDGTDVVLLLLRQLLRSLRLSRILCLLFGSFPLRAFLFTIFRALCIEINGEKTKIWAGVEREVRNSHTPS